MYTTATVKESTVTR